MIKNPLIEKYGNEKRWVNWRPLKVKGRITKIPYSTNGRKASSTDDATWSTYDRVKEKSENIGISFSPDKKLLGIDIDHCLKDNKIEHDQKEIIAQLILEADTYTEISPSGEGLHLFLDLTAPLELNSNKHAPYEAYTEGRYFTVTEKSFHREPQPIRTVSPEEAQNLLSIIGYPWKAVAEGGEGKSDRFSKTNKQSPSLEDDVILKKMFKSKQGAKTKALYEGDLTDYKKGDSNGQSEADLALCSYLAFWTAKNHPQMERIWLASPLGKREKVQDREDYRTRTIGQAIATCKDVYESFDMIVKREAPMLDLLYVIDDKGTKIFIKNTENMCRILRDHPHFEGRLRYDIFKNTLEIKPTKTNQWRIMEDNDAVNIQTAISVMFLCFAMVGKEMIYDAMIKVAKENAMDSAKDYVSSLKWDKEARLDFWLSKTFGVEADEYHKAVASNWIKGLVKRIIDPGCKFDYVLVLEGEQGSKKSMSLSVLGRDWHVETTMSTESKDFFMQFQGKAIIEFSEGETLSRTEVKRMKAIITTQSDKYRPPYERTSQDFPRRCVFAMTTNQSEYLKDETGNRRWLPVKVVFPQANTEWLEANRDQIFAEAHYRLTEMKETIHEFPVEATLKEQNDRRILDPNSEIIVEWYLKQTELRKNEGITSYDAFKEAIHNGWVTKSIDKYHEMIIADTLKNILDLTRKQVMNNKVRSWKWFKKEIPSPLPEDEQKEIAEASKPYKDDIDDIMTDAAKHF